MIALAVDLQRRWNSVPWRWRCLVHSLGRPDSQPADFVEFNRLQPLIRNRQRIARDRSPGPKLVFGMPALSYPNEKFSCFLSDYATHRQGIAHVAMAALIERAGQPDPWLHRKQHTLPRNFPTNIVFLAGSRCQPLQSVFVMQSAEDRSGHDSMIERKPMPGGFDSQLTQSRIGSAWSQGGMRSASIVVRHPRCQDFPQVPFAQRNHPV
jgi:hypothetical protein